MPGWGGEEFLEDEFAEEHTTYILRMGARSHVTGHMSQRSHVTERVWKAVEKGGVWGQSAGEVKTDRGRPFVPSKGQRFIVACSIGVSVFAGVPGNLRRCLSSVVLE